MVTASPEAPLLITEVLDTLFDSRVIVVRKGDADALSFVDASIGEVQLATHLRHTVLDEGAEDEALVFYRLVRSQQC